MLLVETFLPSMPDVGSCELALRELNLMWRLIESSIKMNHAGTADVILPTLARTREHFDRLEAELVASLVQEKLATVVREIGTKAQYVIDIVVRNLYERTADIGFLATDPDLCACAAGIHPAPETITQRLRAYRSKYTVYDEILLLDPQGEVLAQAGEGPPPERSADPLVAQALASDGYVEVFRASDLRPHKQRALIYARRLLHPVTGQAMGVLCLCFNFEEEMAGIFRSHRHPGAPYNMLLLDGEDRCIESADAAWVPLGTVVPVNRAGTPEILLHGGRPYLVSTYAARGYQGYAGPRGWQGQVMIPLELAFRRRATERHLQLDPVLRRGLLAHAGSFCPPLHQILTAADTIRRVVWNGQVMTAGGGEGHQRLRPVLEQISETGSRSNALFASSIRQLYATVLSASLQDAEFVSHLLVDLLDRNLYERADDCRWWALNPVLRHGLARPSRGAGEVAAMREVLHYINGLYTVYTRLFVYDTDGAIVAQSSRDGDAMPGDEAARVPDDVLRQVLALASEQGYVVSPFAPTPLYGDASTYVFHAAIRSDADPARIVGGIGLVFDASRELRAMLSDGLAGKAGAQACFVDRQGRVLASTDPSQPEGTVLDLAPQLLAVPPGESRSELVVDGGQYAIVGSTVTGGYREFRVSDGYREEVLAVVWERFGPVVRNMRMLHADLAATAAAGDDAHEFATFYSGGALFALETASVREARPATEVTPVRIGSPPRAVGLLRLTEQGGREKTVWVFDLGALLTGRPSELLHGSQVVVVAHAGHTIGLLAEELHAVTAFGAAQISDTPLAAEHRLVRGIIRGPRELGLIQWLDLDRLFRLFETGDDAAMPALHSEPEAVAG